MTSKPLLRITRGLPASGKTTAARAWVEQDPARRVRVNRDDFRAMFHGGRLGTTDQERAVTAARDAAVTALLRKGLDVICDDTLLPARHARDLRRLAAVAGADFDVWDYTDVPLDVCILRDSNRRGAAHVGEDVIVDMWNRYVRGREYPLPLPDEPDDDTTILVPYEPVPGTPKAVIVDIDGTVALMGTRSPFDETRVHEDQPNRPVIAAIRAMRKAGHRLIFCSGRTEACRDATELWLDEHIGVSGSACPELELHMRPVGDMRKDAIVKAEIFDKHIRHHYDITAVFDDRQQVVDMWRGLGLTVFQVAPGDF